MLGRPRLFLFANQDLISLKCFSNCFESKARLMYMVPVIHHCEYCAFFWYFQVLCGEYGVFHCHFKYWERTVPPLEFFEE